MNDLPAHLRDAEHIDMASLASDEAIARARKAAQELVDVTNEISELEATLKQHKARKEEISRRELPAIFEGIGTDRIGLPESGVDIVIGPFYHANIAADWEPQRREEAFNWLDENGFGDVIKATVSVEFGRGEYEQAQQLAELIRTQFPGANSHPVNLSQGVPWSTLTSLVREQTEAGEQLPLELLGATVGTQAQIKKRRK